MMKQGKVSVSERALFARVNRALEKQGEILKRCRPASRDYSTLGRYYSLDLKRNAVSRSDIDLESLAKSLGLLKGYEQLVEDDE